MRCFLGDHVPCTPGLDWRCRECDIMWHPACRTPPLPYRCISCDELVSEITIRWHTPQGLYLGYIHEGHIVAALPLTQRDVLNEIVENTLGVPTECVLWARDNWYRVIKALHDAFARVHNSARSAELWTRK